MKWKKSKIWLTLLLVQFCIPVNLFSQSIDLDGQISAWGTIYDQQDDFLLNGGVRFIPALTLLKDLTDERFIDLNVSANSFLFKTEDDAFSEFDLYRLKLRYVTSQSELRIGLQKINFGPAKILRSLRWFDTVDPTDPLKITEGVYGLRYKYNFLNNSEIWLWVLYGNDELKGNEFLISEKKEPEFGGRVSTPFLDGEIAGTFHSRKAIFNNIKIRENRFALDGRWEIEAGLWFESVVSKFDDAVLSHPWQTNLTIGSDYTFNIGNGLMVTAEHFISQLSDKFLGNGKTQKTTALSAAYPMGLIDNFSLFAFYQWDIKKFYQTYQWNRVYDSYILNFNFYHYPDSDNLLSRDPKEQTRSGYGFQFMIIYNF